MKKSSKRYVQCEDDALEVKNAILNIALSGDEAYDSLYSTDNSTTPYSGNPASQETEPHTGPEADFPFQSQP